jgi:hypothetical protein
MTVTVAKFKSLDPASARFHRIANGAGTGASESGLAILFPRLVKRRESRRREGIAGAIEPLVEVVAARRCGMRSNLLEVPPQLVQRLRPERRQQLIPYDLFRALGDVRELRRHDDPQRPRGQRPEQRGVTFEEHSELVQPWVGDDIDDHSAAREMNADR